MPENSEKPKREARRVSLEGEDPVEVLRRLLGTPTQETNKERKRKLPKPPQNC